METYNGLVRQYFPKGYDFTKITAERLLEVEEEINQRPRNILAYQFHPATPRKNQRNKTTNQTKRLLAEIFANSLNPPSSIPRRSEVAFRQVLDGVKSRGHGSCADDIDIGGFPLLSYKLRKFFNKCMPSWVRIDSGWNCTPCTGYCLWRRPMISSSAVHAVISRHSGRVSRFTMSE